MVVETSVLDASNEAVAAVHRLVATHVNVSELMKLDVCALAKLVAEHSRLVVVSYNN